MLKVEFPDYAKFEGEYELEEELVNDYRHWKKVGGDHPVYIYHSKQFGGSPEDQTWKWGMGYNKGNNFYIQAVTDGMTPYGLGYDLEWRIDPRLADQVNGELEYRAKVSCVASCPRDGSWPPTRIGETARMLPLCGGDEYGGTTRLCRADGTWAPVSTRPCLACKKCSPGQSYESSPW